METLTPALCGGPTSPVPPSGGSLEIGNTPKRGKCLRMALGSPFGGIPRNWKLLCQFVLANHICIADYSSPFGGIPRNWKHYLIATLLPYLSLPCSPFGGIPRNWKPVNLISILTSLYGSSPFGGIPRNWKQSPVNGLGVDFLWEGSPFGGIPRNWKPSKLERTSRTAALMFPLRGDP